MGTAACFPFQEDKYALEIRYNLVSGTNVPCCEGSRPGWFDFVSVHRNNVCAVGAIPLGKSTSPGSKIYTQDSFYLSTVPREPCRKPC